MGRRRDIAGTLPRKLGANRFLERRKDVAVVACPNGQLPQSLPDATVTLVQLTQADICETSDVVTGRFSETLVRIVEHTKPDTIIASGGETAQGMLNILGVRSLELIGEASIGVPVSNCEISDRKLNILTKSGGFGGPSLLLE